ncbi:hypothetical protein [Polyangium fumosum]|uniref:Uncharacterized protein n=1 Tax=Polyangium fumosum TaxID=889272 RepID=A0A4U1IW28_9BACT|nr:hypothetical protein [Polyangium fumosum]TKC98741.1 hypothetical protein E8A74_40265 [Polyangium fumosum]
MDTTDETPRTPLACVDGEPFVYADVSPIPGRSPRLDLPLPRAPTRSALCEIAKRARLGG